MGRRNLFWLLGVAAFGCCLAATSFAGDPQAASDWHMNATIIEACSCPMFCQCYFGSGKPAEHHGHDGAGGHYCRFNNAFRVNQGNYGATDLAGAKFWVAGDLGGDFSKGQMDWAMVHFDPSVTPAQREGIAKIVTGHLYPVKWNSLAVGEDAAMEWSATKDRAEARLDGGKRAEVVLTRFAGNTADPVVIENLRYWGAPRNDGFVLMPNEVEAYRTGDKAFEFKGTNGFMITFDISSKDVAPPATGK
jgi:hypothetical protein